MDERFADASALLRHDLTRLLEEHDFPATSPLGADMLCLLHAPGKLLSPTPASTRIPQGFWALLPLTVSRYCQPSADLALLLRVAVSCELLLCALDYFDELEDDDDSAERRLLGDGRLLNAAYTLCVLARRALSTLSATLIAPALLARLLDVADEELLTAVRGQHQDLLAEGCALADISAEECLSADRSKAGALLRLVCRLATLAVNAPGEIGDAFAEIGERVGTAFQIENDTHDLEGLLSATRESGKSDLVRGKKTLPIIFAAQQYAALQHSLPSTDSENQESRDPSLVSRAYEDAIAASLGCAVYLRKEARTLALLIEEQQGRPLPQELYILLGIETL
jgi:geranylgeranyl pyrophosphate synthase